jgi:hypothetical protein
MRVMIWIHNHDSKKQSKNKFIIGTQSCISIFLKRNQITTYKTTSSLGGVFHENCQFCEVFELTSPHSSLILISSKKQKPEMAVL